MKLNGNKLIVIISLLAFIGTIGLILMIPENDKIEASNPTSNIQKISEYRDRGLNEKFAQHVDETGNLITASTNGAVDVTPFKDLTPAQIKILQKKGIVFPKSLLEEKKK